MQRRQNDLNDSLACLKTSRCLTLGLSVVCRTVNTPREGCFGCSITMKGCKWASVWEYEDSSLSGSSGPVTARLPSQTHTMPPTLQLQCTATQTSGVCVRFTVIQRLFRGYNGRPALQTLSGRTRGHITSTPQKSQTSINDVDGENVSQRGRLIKHNEILNRCGRCPFLPVTVRH